MPEYWVVDPSERAVPVWRFARGATEPDVVTDRLTWEPPDASAAFGITMEELFRPM